MLLPDWGAELMAQTVINAVDDTAVTTAENAVNIDVLANDTTTPPGTPLIITDVSNPLNGTSAIGGGQVTYTPNPGFSGLDTFIYVIEPDVTGLPTIVFDTASVTVTVTPIAVNDTATTPANTAVAVSVLDNDVGSNLAIVELDDPSNGTIAISGSTIVYTPATNFVGNDSFGYTISDGVSSESATVNVTVDPPPSPVAVDDTATTPSQTPVTIAVLNNDTGTGITVSAVGTPANGAAVLNNDGTVTYTPAASFAGDDSFTYTITDAFGQSASATVTVTVLPPGLNAVDDSATTPVQTPVTIAVLANDTGTGLVITQVTDPAGGTVLVNADSTITYTPNPDFVGTDVFTYTITDAFGQSDTATVTVTVLAPGLNAVDDAATTPVQTPATISVLNNDTGTDLVISQVSDPANGTAALNDDNTITYTPAAGFAGIDTFTYTITDSFGQSDSATVTITIQAPGLNAVDDTATTLARTPVQINVLANDTGTDLVISQLGNPANGTAVLNADNSVTYTPSSTFAGTDVFSYTIIDSFGQSDSATVTVTVTAPELDAVDDVATTPAGESVEVAVLTNDVGTEPVITQVSEPANGSAVINAAGTITYTANAGFAGADTFTYTISDGISTDTATVTITVTLSKEDFQDKLEDLTENPNEQAVGRSVGGLCFDRAAGDNFLRDCDDLIDAAMNDDPGAGPALTEITPDDLGTALDTSHTSVSTHMGNVRSRLFSLRSGIMGIDIDGLNIQRGGWTLTGQDLQYLSASLGGGGPAANTGVNLGALGIFVSGTANFGDRDATENQAGFDFDTYGLTVGADYRFSDGLVLGTAFTYTDTDTDIDSNGGNLDTQGYSLTLYGTYYGAERFYLDGMLNYGWYDYDQSRNVRYELQNVAVDQRFKSDYDGRQFFIDLGAGYEFAYGNFFFGPETRLSYLDVQVDEFRERADNNNPGSGWAVAVDDQDLQSLVFSLSGRAGYTIDQSWGIMQPQLELTWLHEFEDDRRVVRGRFVEGANVSDNFFELTTDPVDKNYFRLGLGLSARFNNGASALIQYRTLFDYDNLNDHAITTEFRWEF
ncbi:MAG: Ig-like domain-containing protein [Candidatus Competibacteraceae bacterium]|nr:Ig-like domain-containing protein [Candidatus Competibacteraceae bacterium]